MTGSGDGVPEWGTVEFIDGANSGSHNDDLVVSAMEEDEFTIFTQGTSGNSYMYSVGYNETDLACTMLGKHHVSNWVALQMGLVRPYPSTAGTHGTTVNQVLGSTHNPGWVRGRYRIPAGSGFKGSMVASSRQNGGSSTQFVLTPPTNPMTNPGGLCIIGAYKEDDAGYWPDTVVGSDWTKDASGYYAIQARCILPTDEIYTPGTCTFTSPAGSAIWAGLVVYLR